MKTLAECTVLLVDDTETNIEILVEVLGGHYDTMVAMDGESALELMENEAPDLILLDIVMPGIDGYEVCRRLKEHREYRRIPVIFLSALSNTTNKTKGFSLGAVDYITKPFEVTEIEARVKTHLQLVLANRALEEHNEILEECVAKRTRELALTQEVTILGLTSLAETRDLETGDHILRTQRYVRRLAKYLQKHSHYGRFLEDKTIETLYKSAPLHDIGKVGVPDAILQKPGKLSEDEFVIMKGHAALGYGALLKAEELFKVEDSSSFLSHAREIAYSHHEKWDGSGYPLGLAGDEIPLSGRIMAIGDVYDALISARVYKKALPHGQAVQIIREGKGSHFDPEIVDAFLAIEKEFDAIARKYRDCVL